MVSFILKSCEVDRTDTLQIRKSKTFLNAGYCGSTMGGNWIDIVAALKLLRVSWKKKKLNVLPYYSGISAMVEMSALVWGEHRRATANLGLREVPSGFPKWLAWSHTINVEE